MNTIYAVSSGRGKAGVAVVRISGPQCRAIAAAVCGGLPVPRMASLRNLVNPQTIDIIDKSLVLWFPAPHSFTGEDCLELHTHGSVAVLTALMHVLSSFPNVRAAEAGDFTRRAFQNGKMDLTEIEGLSDLLAAETELQRKHAIAHASGVLRKKADVWRAQLLRIMALLEATIDFSDEGDIASSLAQKVAGELRAISQEWQQAMRGANFAERVRDGFSVAITGLPNVGKSSLLNHLAGRDVAIISSIPGTTRDILEVYMDINGLPVKLIDTAGLRESSDVIEAEGIRRARAAIGDADLVLCLHHPLTAAEIDDAIAILPQSKVLHVATHGDVAHSHAYELQISAKTGAGVEALLAAIYARISTDMHATEMPLITRKRHAECFELAQACVMKATHYDLEQHPELAAEELRSAAMHLARLSGRIDVENLLDFIFREFCIGK